MSTLNDTMYDFGDGGGPVPAHRHINPGGDLGGWVANTAYVCPHSTIHVESAVYGFAKVLQSRIGSKAYISGLAVVVISSIDCSEVRGTTALYDSILSSGSVVEANSIVYKSRIYGNSQVSGNSRIESCKVSENVLDSISIRDKSVVNIPGLKFRDLVITEEQRRALQTHCAQFEQSKLHQDKSGAIYHMNALGLKDGLELAADGTIKSYICGALHGWDAVKLPNGELHSYIMGERLSDQECAAIRTFGTALELSNGRGRYTAYLSKSQAILPPRHIIAFEDIANIPQERWGSVLAAKELCKIILPENEQQLFINLSLTYSSEEIKEFIRTCGWYGYTSYNELPDTLKEWIDVARGNPSEDKGHLANVIATGINTVVSHLTQNIIEAHHV